MAYDRPIKIQKIDLATEQWADLWSLHAKVNKATGSEYVQGGANQSKATLNFDLRYFKDLEKVNFDRGAYRIVYRSNPYNITDYDDYMEGHQTVRLTGVSY